MKSVSRAIYTALLCFLLALWQGGYSLAASRDRAVVKSVEADGSLRLQDGRQVVIADVVFPSGKTKAQAALVGKELGFEWLATDRYGRKTAYLYDAENQRLSRWPGAMAYSDLSYAHTKEALAQDDAAAFRVPQEETHRHFHRWRMVEGKVHSVTVLRNQAFLNFGEDWKTDFSIWIPPSTLRRMTPEALQLLQHQTVLVRGYIHPYYGPRITLLNPDMLQHHAPKPNRP